MNNVSNNNNNNQRSKRRRRRRNRRRGNGAGKLDRILDKVSQLTITNPRNNAILTGVNSGNIRSSKRKIDGILKDSHMRKIRYLQGILEPELAVTEGMVVKQPSLLNVPSSTVSFRNNVNLSTDSNGDLFLAWNPNYLANTVILAQKRVKVSSGPEIANNTFSHVVVKDLTTGRLRYIPSYVPDVSLSKYRLVSAKLRVTYIGSLLNQSGMMYGCATFNPTPIGIGHVVDGNTQPIKLVNTSDVDTEISSSDASVTVTLANLTEQNISNGIWNRAVNIVQKNQGMSFIHIPTDPLNEVFYPIGNYFGTLPPSATVSVSSSNPATSSYITSLMERAEGSQLCYLFCAHGLPKSTECINLQVFYNFEVIPTVQSAPFLRGLSETLDSKEVEEINRIISQVTKDTTLIRTGVSKLDSIKQAFNKIANSSTFKIVSSVAPFLIKAISGSI